MVEEENDLRTGSNISIEEYNESWTTINSNIEEILKIDYWKELREFGQQLRKDILEEMDSNQIL